MKYCLSCKHTHNIEDWTCPFCGIRPAEINQVLMFSPEFVVAGESFNPEFYKPLSIIEKDHFWFKARNRILIWAIERFLPKKKSLLEVGCGTGNVLTGLAEAIPDLRLSGSELFPEGLAFAAMRVPQADFFQIDARQIPFCEEFDVIAACDVLEHIEEDEVVIAEIAKALKPGGGVIVTVPQHPFLWSSTDENACHVRRYRAEDLLSKIEKAGLNIQLRTSFVSLLFPFLVISRFLKIQNKSEDVLSELKIPLWQNWLFDKCMTFERALIKCGLRFPFGGSLLIVALKGEEGHN